MQQGKEPKGAKGPSYQEWVNRMSDEDLKYHLRAINAGNLSKFVECPYRSNLSCSEGNRFVKGVYQKGNCDTCIYSDSRKIIRNQGNTYIEMLQSMTPCELENYLEEKKDDLNEIKKALIANNYKCMNESDFAK